jgi:hypothetical protein
MRGDHLIHVRTGPLLERLGRDHYGPAPGNGTGTGSLEERFADVARRIEDLVEIECGGIEEQVKELYAPFSPEDLGAGGAPLDAEARRRGLTALMDRLKALFERANFVEVPRGELAGTTKVATSKGLQVIVDLDAYDEFHLFYRGDAETTQPVTGTAAAYLAKLRRRPVPVETVELYRMVALVTKLRSEPSLRIKLFKDVPKEDVKSLLPNTKVAMRLVDKSRIGISSGGALLSSVKLATKGITMLGPAWVGPVGVVAFLVYLVRTAINFFRIKERYQANLIKELFYQNLDNNLGAINRLIDATEEEETKETVLAYAFLERAGEPLDLLTLDKRIEGWVAERFGVEADFEVDDGARKVLALGLAHEVEGGKIKAVPLEAAFELLRKRWTAIGEGEDLRLVDDDEAGDEVKAAGAAPCPAS